LVLTEAQVVALEGLVGRFYAMSLGHLDSFLAVFRAQRVHDHPRSSTMIHVIQL
jgi:hypothetical protein